MIKIGTVPQWEYQVVVRSHMGTLLGTFTGDTAPEAARQAESRTGSAAGQWTWFRRTVFLARMTGSYKQDRVESSWEELASGWTPRDVISGQVRFG
jgi:hypothetical protein